MGPHQLDLQEYHEASRAPWSHCCRPQGTWVAGKGQEGLKAAPFAQGDIPQAPEAPAPQVALGEVQELGHWPRMRGSSSLQQQLCLWCCMPVVGKNASCTFVLVKRCRAWIVL